MTQMTSSTITQDHRARTDETVDIISSEKVRGTPVFATDGEKIGSVDHLMIGKFDGRVEFAVMSFGGFLGVGESYHPIPWESLDYDTKRGGYVVNIDKEKLKDAPHYEVSGFPRYDRKYGHSIYTFYGAVPPAV